MLTRPEWQDVEQWRVFQHNDDEGHRSTGVICDEVAEQRQVGEYTDAIEPGGLMRIEPLLISCSEE